jgi:hypothetical protein
MVKVIKGPEINKLGLVSDVYGNKYDVSFFDGRGFDGRVVTFTKEYIEPILRNPQESYSTVSPPYVPGTPGYDQVSPPYVPGSDSPQYVPGSTPYAPGSNSPQYIPNPQSPQYIQNSQSPQYYSSPYNTDSPVYRPGQSSNSPPVEKTQSENSSILEVPKDQNITLTETQTASPSNEEPTKEVEITTDNNSDTSTSSGIKKITI